MALDTCVTCNGLKSFELCDLDKTDGPRWTLKVKDMVVITANLGMHVDVAGFTHGLTNYVFFRQRPHS